MANISGNVDSRYTGSNNTHPAWQKRNESREKHTDGRKPDVVANVEMPQNPAVHLALRWQSPRSRWRNERSARTDDEQREDRENSEKTDKIKKYAPGARKTSPPD